MICPTAHKNLAVQQYLIALLIVLPMCLNAGRADSLRLVIMQSRNTTDRLHAMSLLAIEVMPDSMGRARELLKEAAALVEQGNDIQVAGYYNANGLYHWFAGNRHEAIASFKNTLALPGLPSIMSAKAMAANNTGTLFRMIGEIDSAKIYLQRALEIDIQRDYKTGIAKTQYDLAVLFERTDQNHLALRYIIDAVTYQQETGDIRALIHSYNVMGNVYSSFDSAAKASHYYHKGLGLAEATDKKGLMMTYLNNLMSLHAESPDSLAQTIAYFQRGKVLATKYDDFRNLLALHGNMARVYDAANEPEMATSYFLMGMDLFDLADDMGVKASFLLHYGKHLFRNGNISIAEVNLNKALGLARLSGEASTQMSIYRTLASIDSINGNYMEALQNLHRSLTIRDSIYTVKKSASIAEIQLMHNIHQYERMVANLTIENRYNKLRYRFSVLAGITGIALLGLGILYLRKRKIMAENSLTIRELEHSKLQVKYESNRQELTGKAMALMNSERLIKKLQSDFKLYLAQADDECRHKLQPVIRDLNTEDKSKELWHDFENRFNELNDGFISKLTAAHPNLSPTEIRLCAMLRLQMPSKEISRLSQRSLRTIEQTRFKIRKKIGLKSGDNLVNYLLKL